MAYHILNINSNGEPEIWEYVKKEDLIDCDYITPFSLIYDTDTNKPPFIASTDKFFNSISDTHKRLGFRAEMLFLEQAFEKGLITEKINQDEGSMVKYRNATEHHIKRGDFTIRGKGKEVEVKCLKTYPTNVPLEKRFVYLSYYQIQCHARFSKHLNESCFLVLYIKEGNTIYDETPRIISLNEVANNPSKFEYDPIRKATKIPLSKMSIGFEALHAIVENS